MLYKIETFVENGYGIEVVPASGVDQALWNIGHEWSAADHFHTRTVSIVVTPVPDPTEGTEAIAKLREIERLATA